MLTEEKILKNYETFRALCRKLGPRADDVSNMLDHFDTRLSVAPASSRQAYHASYPGGLVDHSLRVFQNARIMNDTFKHNIPIESLIIACLFHDFGKVGDLEQDLYLPQTNSWRADNLGENYVYNRSIQMMPNAERGLWIIQHFGIKLTMDEWLAIRLNDGPIAEENRSYSMHEPLLALIVHQADRLACHQEKQRDSNS